MVLFDESVGNAARDSTEQSFKGSEVIFDGTTDGNETDEGIARDDDAWEIILWMRPS